MPTAVAALDFVRLRTGRFPGVRLSGAVSGKPLARRQKSILGSTIGANLSGVETGVPLIPKRLGRRRPIVVVGRIVLFGTGVVRAGDHTDGLVSQSFDSEQIIRLQPIAHTESAQ